jgi:hypothetical protein
MLLNLQNAGRYTENSIHMELAEHPRLNSSSIMPETFKKLLTSSEKKM